MTNLPTDQEKHFLRGSSSSSSSFKPRFFHHPPSSPSNNRNYDSKSNYTHPQQENATEKEGFPTAVSWPILLAIIPTLGTFIGGSAESWSDFIMLLLILYYVYKWITGKAFQSVRDGRRKFILNSYI